MDTLLLENCPSTDTLVKRAHEVGEPVALSDGAGECLVVMTPMVFERILFDTALISLADGENSGF